MSEGKGQLVLTFWKGSTPIGEGGGVWLDIKSIKKMYQRYDSASAHRWTADNFEADPTEDKQNAIVFVHGWRMSPEGAENFAETMYKRLWHEGYKGRFAAFHWDTYWAEGWEIVPYVGGGINAYLAHYNDSEHIAWQAASSLKSFVNSLPFKTKNIAAHSMGNVVTSEAIYQGMHVDNYALMQPAIPASCYDENPALEQTTSTTHYGVIPIWDSKTPDDDEDGPTRTLAYRGRFKTMGTNLINFYLPNDYATFLPWETNNDLTKPPGGALAVNFSYERNGASGHKLYKHNGATMDHYLSDPYEAMPYACRSWGKAAGAEPRTRGSIGTTPVNLSDSTYQLPGVQGSGFGDQHSGQFNFSIQELKPFYNTLLDKLKVKRNP